MTLIKKSTVLKIMASAMSSVCTVSAFKYADVGAVDDISLQSPVSSLEIIEPYVPNDVPAVSSPSSTPKRLRRDAVKLEENTILVSSEDLDTTEEILDESTFTYDGSEVWINVNLANVREEPNVDSEIVDQVEYGSSLVRISYGTLWSKVRLEDGTEGYIMSSLLDEEEIVAPTPTPSPTPTPEPTPAPTAAPTPTPVPQQEPEQTAAQTEAVVETTAATTTAAPAPSYTESEYYATVYASCDINVRTGPGTSSSFVTLISRGDSIEVVAQTDNGWYKLPSGNYVKADLCCNEPLPEPTPAPAPDPAASPVSAGDGSDFANYCCQFVGVSYVYGGASPSGFDCSGYVSYIFANYYGVSLPHDAAGIAQCGTAVSMDSLQCGDVICHDYNNDGYIEHVSIYIGNGTYIHASDSRRGVVITNYCGGVATVRRFV